MKNEDRIVEVLSEILIESKETNKRLSTLETEQKETNKRLLLLESEQKETNKRLESLEDDMHISHSLLKHQEGWLRLISDVLNKEVAKYDQVMTIEHLDNGRVILHKA